MIVSKNVKFEPITIILETEEEALTLWHNLNISVTRYKAGNAREKDYICKVSKMWRALDDIYRPLRESEGK